MHIQLRSAWQNRIDAVPSLGDFERGQICDAEQIAQVGQIDRLALKGGVGQAVGMAVACQISIALFTPYVFV
jgi:hypothetical protein